MKRYSLVFLLFLIPLIVKSQDTILLRNGQKIICDITKSDSSLLFFEINKNNQKIKTFVKKDDIQDIKYNMQSSLKYNSPNINYDFNDSLSNIYFYRLPYFVGSAIRMKIFSNGTPIVRLKNGHVFKYKAKSGDYRFTCKMADSSSLKLTIEPNKSYFIKCYLYQGLWSAIPVIEMIDSVSARAVLDGGDIINQPYEQISMIRPKSRIGLTFGAGVGFEDIPMGLTDKGEKLTLSTGGGGTIGAEFGHEFYKYFDLSINWFYQFSYLTPSVNNGDATFDRMGILITPALIIPIKGGEYFRLRFGAGLGLYSFGTMNVNASNAGGGNYVLNYNSAIGYHGSVVFESFFSEKASFTIGVKYYNVNYNYTSDGSTGTSTNSKVMNPDGSGLDFLLGYHYHF